MMKLLAMLLTHMSITARTDTLSRKAGVLYISVCYGVGMEGKGEVGGRRLYFDNDCE